MMKALWAEFQGRPNLVRGLQTLFIALIFAFLFRNLYLNWGELSTYRWSLNYLALAGSLFLLLADAFLYAYLTVLGDISQRKGHGLGFLARKHLSEMYE